MKVFITGITGNIGYAVYEALMRNENLIKEENVEVIGGVRNIKKSQSLFSQGIELRRFDFEDGTTFENLKDIDSLFLVRPPQISDYKLINHFIDVVIDYGVKHIVFLSLMGIEKNPFPPHRKIEDHLKSVNCTYTFLRPSFFMQNLLEAHLEDIKKDHDLFIPSGKAKLSFIDAYDIGEVASLCLIQKKHENKAYTLTGSESLNYFEVASIMTEVLGMKITYSKPGLLKFRKRMLKRGDKKDYINVMLFLNIMTRLNTASKVTNDVEELLGRKPRLLKEFIKINQEKFK